MVELGEGEGAGVRLWVAVFEGDMDMLKDSVGEGVKVRVGLTEVVDVVEVQTLGVKRGVLDPPPTRVGVLTWVGEMVKEGVKEGVEEVEGHTDTLGRGLRLRQEDSDGLGDAVEKGGVKVGGVVLDGVEGTEGELKGEKLEEYVGDAVGGTLRVVVSAGVGVGFMGVMVKVKDRVGVPQEVRERVLVGEEEREGGLEGGMVTIGVGLEVDTLVWVARGEGGRENTEVGVTVMDKERVGEVERLGVMVGEVERVGEREWVVERERVGLKESVREVLMEGVRVDLGLMRLGVGVEKDWVDMRELEGDREGERDELTVTETVQEKGTADTKKTPPSAPDVETGAKGPILKEENAASVGFT